MSNISWAFHLFLKWLLQTRMSFYGTDLKLRFWWYGICCWSYVFAGIVMIYTEPVYLPTWFPYRLFAYFLIFIQSPLSFLADYVYVNQDSYWHVVDRCFAVPCMILECTKFVIMLRRTVISTGVVDQTELIHQRSSIICFLYGVALSVAAYSFLMSQHAQATLQPDEFQKWHTIWHTYPIIASCVVLTDYFFFEGWKNCVRNKKNHIQ